MTARREFLRTLGAAAAVPAFSRRGAGSFEEVLAGWAHPSLAAGAGDEEFWETVRGEFRQSPAFVNLENGYLSPQPESTLRVLEEEIRAFNLRPSHYMRRDWNADRPGGRATRRNLPARIRTTGRRSATTRRGTARPRPKSARR